MIFHSLDYVVFFLASLTVYWILPLRAQNIFLLLASYFFYAYVHPWFLLLVLIATLVSFSAGLGIENFPNHKNKFLAFNILVNVGLLGYFKYGNFFIENINLALGALGFSNFATNLQIFLPVGISFFTFQVIGYTIDVYREEIRAERDLINFALFKSFFPQLVAGPIERATHMLPQIKAKRSLSPLEAREAIFLLIWGFFKKLVVADNVALIANKIFMIKDPSFYLLWTGVFAFAIQIYADFSAYSDIARGSAAMFGFKLIKNFNYPYLSKSITEFWTRWHISLSSWFRDYVYYPLVLRNEESANNANRYLLATFLISGLWHGASWNYVLWGFYHGSLGVLDRYCGQWIPPHISRSIWLAPLRTLLTFVLVCFGWLLFRETDFYYLRKYICLSPFVTNELANKTAFYLFVLSLLYGLPIWLECLWGKYSENRTIPLGQTKWVLASTLLAIALFILILVVRARTSADFIYFQF